MNQEKLDKLDQLLGFLNGEGVTKKEFVTSFKKVFNRVIKIENDVIEKADREVRAEKEKLKQLTNEFNSIIEEARAESDSTLGGIRQRISDMISNVFAKNEVNQKLKKRLLELDNKLNEVNDSIDRINSLEVKNGADGADGEDGKDADEDKIIEEVLNKIELPKIDTKEIEELKAEIKRLEEELKKRPIGGGGTSAMGVANAAKYFVKTEAPSGTIDGANKEFTVLKPIFAVLSFSLNGEFIAQLPNYTISNKTITFSEALPADYSGKDFEITYI
jgi:DNA repair exonuclease SbcCD ATPase subunit